MRNLAIQITDAKDALLRNEAVRAQIGVEITLSDNTILRWGTADFFLETYNSTRIPYEAAFVSKLRQLPELRFALTSVVDGGRFTFENLDYAISQTLGGAGYAFARAQVRVFYCFQVGPYYQGELLFIGRLRDALGNSTIAEFSVVSDLADVKALVANRQLTQKCLAVLGDDRCGLSVNPGDVCTKVFDDAVGGCAFWGNQARFWGVPFITAEQLGIGTLGGGSGWIEPGSGGGGGGYCCDPFHYVKTPQGAKRLGELQPGDMVLDHTGGIGLVTKAKVRLAPRRYFLETSNGLRIVCTPKHPVYARLKENNVWREIGYAPLINLTKPQATEILTHNGQHTEWATYSLGVTNSGPVVELTLEAPHWYLVNAEPVGGGIVSHNLKGIFWEIVL